MKLHTNDGFPIFRWKHIIWNETSNHFGFICMCVCVYAHYILAHLHLFRECALNSLRCYCVFQQMNFTNLENVVLRYGCGVISAICLFVYMTQCFCSYKLWVASNKSTRSEIFALKAVTPYAFYKYSKRDVFVWTSKRVAKHILSPSFRSLLMFLYQNFKLNLE